MYLDLFGISCLLVAKIVFAIAVDRAARLMFDWFSLAKLIFCGNQLAAC